MLVESILRKPIDYGGSFNEAEAVAIGSRPSDRSTKTRRMEPTVCRLVESMYEDAPLPNVRRLMVSRQHPARVAGFVIFAR